MKNIDGRIHGGKDLVQFFQTNFRKPVSHADISYNEVINVAGNSAVEDNINIFNTRGSPSSPMRIHNNFILGAYPAPGETRGYTGGGIISDSYNSTADQASAYLDIEENQVISSLNYTFGIASGNNIRMRKNRGITSPYLDDGRQTSIYTNAWSSGFWAQDYCKMNSTFNNVMDGNTVGIVSWGNRKDYSDNLVGTTATNWIRLPDPITLDLQKNEYTIFLNKLRSRGIFIGPRLGTRMHK